MDVKDHKNETEHLEHTLSLNEDGEKYDPSREGPRGIDAELAQYADGERIEISEEENSRLRWLVNRRVLSFMLCEYWICSVVLLADLLVSRRLVQPLLSSAPSSPAHRLPPFLFLAVTYFLQVIISLYTDGLVRWCIC